MEKENSILKQEGNKLLEKVNDIEEEYGNKIEEIENNMDSAIAALHNDRTRLELLMKLMT